MDLSKLSPEEKDKLLMDLVAKFEGGEGPVAEPDSEFSRYDKLCGVIELMCNEIEAMQEQVAAIRKLVVDDFLGGLEGMYKSNVRKQGISGLREKYGELFSPYDSVLKTTDPGEDLFEKLYDEQESMRGGEGFSDEMFDGKVKEYAVAIGKKIEELKASGELPEDAEVKVDVELPEEPKEETKAGKFMREMKEKNDKRGVKAPALL